MTGNVVFRRDRDTECQRDREKERWRETERSVFFRELQDMKEENEELVRSYRRLQLCCDIVQNAGRCNESCLAVRRKKVLVCPYP